MLFRHACNASTYRLILEMVSYINKQTLQSEQYDDAVRTQSTYSESSFFSSFFSFLGGMAMPVVG
jgi:hypothetical protein